MSHQDDSSHTGHYWVQLYISDRARNLPHTFTPLCIRSCRYRISIVGNWRWHKYSRVSACRVYAKNQLHECMHTYACICIISSAVQAYGCMHTNTYVYGDADAHTYVCAYVRKITGIYLLYLFSVHKNTGMCACKHVHTYVCMGKRHLHAGVIT